MKKLFFPFVAIMFTITSCSQFTSKKEYDAVKAENDSLRMVQKQVEQEMNQYMSAINSVQENLETIKQSEKILTMKKMSKDLSASDIEQINKDLKDLADLLKKNKEELQTLRQRVKNSSFKISELQKTVDMLTQNLQEETNKVMQLTAELEKKNVLIDSMSIQIAEQADNIKQLEDQSEAQTSKMQEQDEALNTAWYAFGSRKELKEQNIINRKGAFAPQRVLESDFNKDYFVKIDIRNTQEIPLFSSRAKILTNHPKSSYTLEKNDKNLVLVIVDYKAFWSVSRYLVVEVD